MYGKRITIELPDTNIGLSSGLERITLFGNYASCQAIAHSNLIALKTTGLNELQKMNLTIVRSDILFMMQPIFTKMVVC